MALITTIFTSIGKMGNHRRLGGTSMVVLLVPSKMVGSVAYNPQKTRTTSGIQVVYIANWVTIYIYV